MEHTFETELNGKKLQISTGKLALQAGGAVLVQMGETMVLATACASSQPRQDVDFLPLTVDVAEKFYAVGRLPGGFFKREARPSMEAILTARLCDRPLRPLFPKNYHNDTQIIITVLSSDKENPYQALGIVGASAALAISDIPFESTLGACVIGLVDDALVVNPTYEELSNSRLELTVAGTADAIMMVEAGAKFVSEDKLVEALELAQETNSKIAGLIDEMRTKVGKTKLSLPATSEEDLALVTAVKEQVGTKFEDTASKKLDKQGMHTAVSEIKKEVLESLSSLDQTKVKSELSGLEKEAIRAAILHKKIRPDGRKKDEIRPLSSEVSLLPRVHGSAIFMRGETQIMNAVTLAPLGEKQKIDGLTNETEKRFIHHYNFPPYSVGEAGRFGFTGRREVGHGALAERAMSPVIPSEEDFPYTIRSVSEALGSNGSTSMASVCSGILAMMDAGVPIKEPVAGIAMGLVKDEDGNYAVLTDIQGAEDHCGDMDFKVTGTRDGVTALQMDIKVKGINFKIMSEALEQARIARLEVLDHMQETLSSPREEVNRYAPRVLRSSIPVDKIGALIGPGGANIKKLTEEFGVNIDVKEDGTLLISAENSEIAKQAEKAIKGVTKEFELGEVCKGKVVRIVNFGAFVEIAPGKDGLVHISELNSERVDSVESVVSLGDEVEAMVVKIDDSGRIDLSMRAVAEGITLDKDNPQPFGRDRTNRAGGSFRSGRHSDRPDQRRDRDRRRSFGGDGDNRDRDRRRSFGDGDNRDRDRRRSFGGDGDNRDRDRRRSFGGDGDRNGSGSGRDRKKWVSTSKNRRPPSPPR